MSTILAELGMDTTTLVAALLHDTVEDTDYPLDKLRAEFGEEVAHLVDGVTKLDKVEFGNAAEAETIRKMVVAMARDPRVLVIKLSDRLHNMRTMRFLAPEKQARKARETLEVMAPLAHRLGMATVKWELEDLSFAILHPKKYSEIVRLVATRAPSRDTYLKQVIDEVTAQLDSARITATVEGRPKHYYSIYRKMIVKGRDFDDIHDLVGVRVLVDEVRDCYAAMGMVHALWQPMPGRFKDYIAQPRFGVYQSLHTTVIGPDGKPLEVQIRTHDMHRTAEYGIAAHWRYKETPRHGAVSAGTVEVDEMAWMRQLLDWQREAADPGDFLESLRYDLASQEIFVFTPKGDVITLPSGSTPVDLAYAVHTEVGNRCIGSRVNGRLVALERKLESGDVVEIFTSKAETAGPSRDWLAFVASPRAKTKIKQWFAKERREEAIEAGKEAITREARRTSMPLQRLVSADAMAALSRELHFPDLSGLYAAIGEGHASARHVVQRLVALLGGEEQAEEELAERATPSTIRPRRVSGDAGVVVRGDGSADLSDLYMKLARCCTPVPGDEILGFVTRGGGVSVHRTDCTNASDLQVPRRAAGRRGLVGVARLGVPGGHPGRGAGPAPAAVRHHQGAGRREGQHPVRLGDHQPGPGGDLAVHLRDGRPQAPRARAARGAQRGGRLRRLPGDQRQLTGHRTSRWPVTRTAAQPTAAVWMVTPVTGLPSPGPLALSDPAWATASTVANPASPMVPNTVYSGGSVESA